MITHFPLQKINVLVTKNSIAKTLKFVVKILATNLVTGKYPLLKMASLKFSDGENQQLEAPIIDSVTGWSPVVDSC